MKGYVLFDKDYRRLTKDLRFSDHENAGWLWTTEEAMQIIEKGIKVVSVQHCELIEEDGDVNVYALEEIEEI